MICFGYRTILNISTFKIRPLLRSGRAWGNESVTHPGTSPSHLKTVRSLFHWEEVPFTLVVSNSCWPPLTPGCSEAFRSTEGDLCAPVPHGFWTQLCLESLGTDMMPETRLHILIFCDESYLLFFHFVNLDKSRSHNIYLCISLPTPDPESWVPLHTYASFLSR